MVLPYMYCCLFSNSTADAHETPEAFIAFLKSIPLQSGEMTVTVTDYAPLVPQRGSAAAGTATTYHAVWNNSDVLCEEVTPELSNRTNPVTGFLVGRHANLYWHAVGSQLNLYVKTNNSFSYDPANDNNTVHYFVGFAQSLIRKYLEGGNDLEDMNWSGTHLVAKADHATIAADLDFSRDPAALLGTYTAENLAIPFRVDYLDWGTLKGARYARKCEEYAKTPDDKEFRKLHAFEIVDLRVPFVGDQDIFTPSYHLDTNYFKSYVYIHNDMYFIEPAGLTKVRPAVVSRIQSPLHRFIISIVMLSVIFFPLALWLGLKYKHKQQ